MHGTGTTRIDTILANPCGARGVVDLRYDWDQAIGFDHVPITITVNHALLSQEVRKLRKPAPAPIGDIKANAKFVRTDHVWHNVWQQHQQRYLHLD